MSISNPRLVNPAPKIIEFKGDKGVFQYYDSIEKKSIEFPMPFYFIVLDELSAITGYNDEHKCGIYSNEIHYLNDEILRVKTFRGGESIIGKYNDIKDEVKSIGGRFAKMVYALLIKSRQDFEMVRFKLSGAAFSAWIEKKINTETLGIEVKETTINKKGAITYQSPVFSSVNIEQKLMNVAVKYDKELQKYLSSLKNIQAEQIIKQDEQDEQNEQDNYEDIPINEMSAMQVVKDEAVNNDVSEETKDLPF